MSGESTIRPTASRCRWGYKNQCKFGFLAPQVPQKAISVNILQDQNYLWPSMETSEYEAFTCETEEKFYSGTILTLQGQMTQRPNLFSALHCLGLQWILHRLTALSGAADIFSTGFWWTYRQLWYVLRSWRVGWKSSLGEEEDDWLNILQW